MARELKLTAKTAGNVALLPPLRTSGRQEGIYEVLREAIINGVLVPGERLLERELASRFATSQTPVREALRRLGQEGLVITYPYRGTFVRQFSAAEVEEVFSLRTELEGWAVRRFIARAEQADLDELRGYLDAMRDAMKRGDRIALADADLKFHYKICEGSGSKLLLQLWDQLDSRVRGTLTLLKKTLYDLHIDHVATHAPILDAIVQRDGARAEELIQRHPLWAWEKIKERLRPDGEVAVTASAPAAARTPRSRRGKPLGGS